MDYKVVLISLIMLTLLFSLSGVSANDLNETLSLEENDVIELETTHNFSSNGMAKVNESNSTPGESSVYLVLDNDADKENIYLGDLVSWIISVENLGPDMALNVQVYDELPDGLDYLYHYSTKGSFNPDTGIWNIGDLKIEDGEVFLFITCKAISVGEKINKVYLSSDTFNLNNKTFEKEEIDVCDYDGDDDREYNNVEKVKSNLKGSGNPIFLILMSLILAFSGFVVKR